MRELPDIQDPKEIILWVISNSDKNVLVTSLGKQTTIIIDIIHKLNYSIPIYMIDTDLLFEETYKLKKKIEEKYSIEILSIKTDISLEDQSIMYGPNLWHRNPDLCCNIRKVKPLNKFLKNYDAWITGVRRDQSESRKNILPIEFDDAHDLLKINPLAYWTIDDVDNYIENNDVPYNILFDSGYRSIGCMPCTSNISQGNERGGRWEGFEKTECGIHNYILKKEK